MDANAKAEYPAHSIEGTKRAHSLNLPAKWSIMKPYEITQHIIYLDQDSHASSMTFTGGH